MLRPNINLRKGFENLAPADRRITREIVEDPIKDMDPVIIGHMYRATIFALECIVVSPGCWNVARVVTVPRMWPGFRGQSDIFHFGVLE